MASESGQDMVKAAIAARKLGVHPRTVKRAVASGQIPGTRVGSVYLVNAAWLRRVTTWHAREGAA